MGTASLRAAVGLALLLLAAGSLAACEQAARQRPLGPPVGPRGPLPLAAEAGTEPRGGPQPLFEAERERRALEAPEIYPGREGRFPAPPPSQARALTLPGGEVTLNFVNADIREVVATLLGETLGLNYVIDPAVTGSVTVRSAKPLPRGDVLSALESILAMAEAALIAEGPLYRVVPLAQAAASTPRPLVSPPGAALPQGYALHLIPVRYANAGELADNLSGFVAPGRLLAADPRRNLLLFQGPAPEAEDLLALVEVFDVDWLADRSVGIFPLDSARPEDLIEELAAIYGTAEAGGPQFLPIERLGAVLVIAQDRTEVERAGTWISRLDRGEQIGEEPQLYVYFVENGRAADLALVLQQIFGGAPPSAIATPERRAVSPGLAPAYLTRPEVGELRPTGQVPRGPVPEPEAAMRLEAPEEAAGPLAFASERLRIIADDVTNAIVILAPPQDFRMVERTLRQLDIVPLQVLIEATIAEVTLNDALRYGVQWFFEFGDASGFFTRSASPVPFPRTPGFGFILEGTDGRIVLDALAEVTDINVVSAPQLTVRDNQPARLNVGDQVPIPVRTSVSVIDPDAPQVNEIEYRDTGVILELVPRVNSGGLVSLDILQEVSDVVQTTSSGIDAPTISQRTIRSSVAVHSGDTLVLGGLIRESQENGESGLPILKDIPILGNLFKTTTITQERTELLVLITPRVISNRRQAQILTEEIRRRFRAAEQLRLETVPAVENPRLP